MSADKLEGRELNRAAHKAGLSPKGARLNALGDVVFEDPRMSYQICRWEPATDANHALDIDNSSEIFAREYTRKLIEEKKDGN